MSTPTFAGHIGGIRKEEKEDHLVSRRAMKEGKSTAAAPTPAADGGGGEEDYLVTGEAEKAFFNVCTKRGNV